MKTKLIRAEVAAAIETLLAEIRTMFAGDDYVTGNHAQEERVIDAFKWYDAACAQSAPATPTPARMAQLQTRVEAYNEAGNFAREIVPAMLAALAPFVGQKVLNQGNVRSAKLMRALPEDSAGTASRNFHYTNSAYVLRADFRVCKNVPGQSHCVYADVTVALAELDPQTGIVRKVYTPDELQDSMRNDYTAAAVLEARADHAAAEQATSEAYTRTAPFYLNDN